MEIWLDSINQTVILDAVNKGVLSGITTNPSILAKAHHVKKTLEQLLEIQEGPIAVQVISNKGEGMFEEGMRIFDFSDRMVVKVPVTEEGLEAIHKLCSEGVPVLATAVFEPSQALLAAHLGAAYVTPYLSHLGEGAFEKLETMIDILSFLESDLLVASIRELDHVVQLASLGIEAITIKDDLYHQLIHDSSSWGTIEEKFKADWHQMHGKASMIDLLKD